MAAERGAAPVLLLDEVAAHLDEERRRHLNARSTLSTLIGMGCVPVINENDTVATSEIRFGDNDRLAARVAAMISADTLVLLSDIDGLYTADPKRDPEARHLPEVRQLTPKGSLVSAVTRMYPASSRTCPKVPMPNVDGIAWY